MKAAISIFVFIISAGAAILFYINAEEQQYAAVMVIKEKPQFICGTYYISPLLNEKAKAGKQLFNTNCAACHKLDKYSTGPPLRNINERFTTEDIIKFIRNDFSGTIKYTEKSDYKCTSFPNLSDIDIQTILHYTN
ncbi:cytochrome c [uncultured Kordia sp.]|uniref:c-type cytochrome n=1 Tax=uncultured Kordia sp. TaxID=507699 RepID=UPI002603DE1D|nr:cytochrome c [uncultured Kordia sp.]